MRDVYKHSLYTKVPRQECRRETGNEPTGTRWVDTNQGDSTHPEYRSRRVPQEINDYTREDMFAATPPLEAKTLRLSMATTGSIGWDHKWRRSMQLEFIYVGRAYGHAAARRITHVPRPDYDREEGTCVR